MGWFSKPTEIDILDQNSERSTIKLRYFGRDIQEYLGPIAYNAFDQHIYYYSQCGFFRVDEQNGAFSRTFLAQPELIWNNFASGGPAMNVVRFEFVSEKELFFLTTDNGIGYYNGETFRFFN